jgi:hypothetical protein
MSPTMVFASSPMLMSLRPWSERLHQLFLSLRKCFHVSDHGLCLFANVFVSQKLSKETGGAGFSEEKFMPDYPYGHAGPANVEKLVNLESLYLSNTKVTDAGLEHLRGLAKLRGLKLNGLPIAD